MTHTDANDATLPDLARDVAQHLGPQWSVDPSTSGQRDRPQGLCGPDGARLLVGFDDWVRARRVEIWGTYPDRIGLDYRITRHEITLSRARGAQVIARDIHRRLLPVYLPDLRTAQGHVIRRAQEKQARAHTAARIGAALPGAMLIEDNARGHLTCDIRLDLPADSWGTIHLDHDGQKANVTFYRVPADALVRMIAALGDSGV